MQGAADGLRSSAAAVRLQRARADDRRADDAPPPRQAPPGLRDRRQRPARGHRMGRQAGRGGAEEPRQAARRQAGRRPQPRPAAITTIRSSGSGCRRTAAASPTATCAPRSTPPSGRSTTSRRKFKDDGVKRFGSGWAWLVHDGSGLALLSTANQDSPISDGKTPLLGNDVWEHAYYLTYKNRRPDYLDAWWNVVNWPKVAEGFAAVESAGRTPAWTLPSARRVPRI